MMHFVVVEYVHVVVPYELDVLVVEEFVRVVLQHELDVLVVNDDFEQQDVDVVRRVDLHFEEAFDLYDPHNTMLLDEHEEEEDDEYLRLVNNYVVELFFEQLQVLHVLLDVFV
jgi:hypothetical protein